MYCNRLQCQELHGCMADAPAGPPPVRDGFPVIQNEDGSISEVLAVSKHLVGKLIGKGGTTIQQLQATTATNIQIDQVRAPLQLFVMSAVGGVG